MATITMTQAKDFVAKVVGDDALLPHHRLGLRAVDEVLSIGDAMADSRVWDDNNPTDEMLDGCSAIEVARDTASGCELAEPSNWQRIRSYSGRVYLIDGVMVENGNDPGEVILRDAIVIARIRVGES